MQQSSRNAENKNSKNRALISAQKMPLPETRTWRREVCVRGESDGQNSCNVVGDGDGTRVCVQVRDASRMHKQCQAAKSRAKTHKAMAKLESPSKAKPKSTQLRREDHRLDVRGSISTATLQ